MAEFVSRVDRISKGNVLLSQATVGDDVSIHLPYEVCKSLPSRSAGKLLWGTKYNKADIGREFVVDMDEFDVCPLDDARTIFYLGKMKSEGAVVKVCDENKTVQIELLQQVYVPLNMQCTFTYNGKKYEGKVTKIVK